MIQLYKAHLVRISYSIWLDHTLFLLLRHAKASYVCRARCVRGGSALSNPLLLWWLTGSNLRQRGSGNEQRCDLNSAAVRKRRREKGRLFRDIVAPLARFVRNHLETLRLTSKTGDMQNSCLHVWKRNICRPFLFSLRWSLRSLHLKLVQLATC